ncbi:unnamed protein product, partial [marine sediment metagenome]
MPFIPDKQTGFIPDKRGFVPDKSGFIPDKPDRPIKGALKEYVEEFQKLPLWQRALRTLTPFQGLETIGKVAGGITEAIAEPEKGEAPTVPGRYEEAFARGFREPEKTRGVFGKEFAEQYPKLPWQVAGGLGTAAELGLYELPARIAGITRGIKFPTRKPQPVKLPGIVEG